MTTHLPWLDIYLGIAAFPATAVAYLWVVWCAVEAGKLLRKYLKSPSSED